MLSFRFVKIFYFKIKANPDLMQWNSLLYDDKHSFVFKNGVDLVTLLDPKPGQNILDLGCGTGYLSEIIRKSGANVFGVDASAEMIQQATKRYPEVHFEQMDAKN
ncbi:MAG: class I SAM-dependent methyltransferase [Chitinophagaceae bacterium]